MKRVLITGGTGKIGSQITTNFVKKNFEVFITFYKSVEKIQELKETLNHYKFPLKTFQCDLRSNEMIQKFYEDFQNQYNSLDILINCAGIFPSQKFNEVSERDYHSVMDLNLKSVYFLIQKFSQIMSENSVIINFSSVGGIIPWKSRSLYHISKAGVIALTRSLAIELAPKIRVNSIAPGYIELDPLEHNKMPLSKIPLGRYGRIENIIQTIEFIIANDYLTGVTIQVDGGRSLI